METYFSRRSVLLLAAASLPALAAGRVFAQETGPIKIGSLVPLSGAGGAFGPDITAGHLQAVEEANAAGGVGGRTLAVVREDDESNPDAGVRAARKLINLDGVQAILGPWSSAVASAIAPLCWESRIMLICIGSADSITALPHQGYIARTQPSTTLYAQQFGRFALEGNPKQVFVMIPQTPFTQATVKGIETIVAQSGVKLDHLIYDVAKTSFRTEVDIMLRSKPDVLILGGYLNDNIILAKDLFRAGYEGVRVAYGTGAPPAFLEAAGVAGDGLYTLEPTADADSAAYKRLQGAVGRDTLGTYFCQGYDQATLAILAMASGTPTGESIKDNIRAVGNPAGTVVDNVADGLKALGEGKSINYLGASGPCKFAPNGDIENVKFRINLAKDGKYEKVRTL